MDLFNETSTFVVSSQYHHLISSDKALRSTGGPSLLSLPLHQPLDVHNYTLVAILLLLLWPIHLLFVRPRLSIHRHIPAPQQGLAIFRLLHEPKVTELEHWIDTIPNDGLIRYYGLWNEERIFAASPDAVKDLLVKKPYSYIKPRLQYVLADNIASKGLLIQEGDTHRAARKAFNPAFNAERIRKAYPIMLSSANQLLGKIEDQTKQESHRKPIGQASILKPISAVATDIIGHWGFSQNFNALDRPKAFGKAYIEMFKTTERGQRTLDAAAKIGPELALKLPLRAVKTIKRVMALVRQTSEEIVLEHEQNPHAKDDMLTTIIKTNHFTHTELVDQTVHFLAAATETVSGSIAWAMHLISRHPEIQARLRQEIRTHIPSPTSLHSSPDHLATTLEHHMPYLNAFVKEVLRFHSINTILWRQSISDSNSLCGHRIPSGTKISFSPWTLNRDPAHWGPDARIFNPQRWISDPVSGGADHSYSFLTFGAGARRCIGETYAKAQMRCVVAALVGGFEWRPVEELEGDRGSDVGTEVGDDHALTLFKILEGWRVRCTRVEGW